MSELTEQVRAYFSAMGKKGGGVRGASKARTREQAQRAVNTRWERYRLAKQADQNGAGQNSTESSP
jgi:hypothetical protein